MSFEEKSPVIRDTSIAYPSARDEDWHIAYPLPGVQDKTVAEHCRQLFHALEDSCLFDEDEECHVFPTGKAFYICTNWANLTRRYFGEDRAVVMGYLHDNNETSAISEKYEGHDFTLLDGRYIVDGWVTGVGLEKPGRATPGLYDLQNEDDAAEIARLYGNQAAWELSGSSYESTEPKPF
ncbi:hypothetical protein [Rhizobium sp. MHM7A]|uniref:hypothetical protein n=1 Tax=Rhizobium sp. MHM7A TaxID=2583233 RepID=UPI001105C415|nr:hypothetical protein [Rhizobium sp. MHM7A]TLX15909.1 hypothetical protein FFR93_00925 [Rhizobium sp. MHM7A]